MEKLLQGIDDIGDKYVINNDNDAKLKSIINEFTYEIKCYIERMLKENYLKK